MSCSQTNFAFFKDAMTKKIWGKKHRVRIPEDIVRLLEVPSKILKGVRVYNYVLRKL